MAVTQFSGYSTVPELLEKDPNRSVWSVIVEQNKYDKELLEAVADGKLKIRIQKDFFDRSSERMSGQWTFSMTSYNIKPGGVSCKHNCTYCYETPTPGMDRYKRPKAILDIEDVMPVDPAKVRKRQSAVSNVDREVYFFPSTSDIFVENAQDYVTACTHLIDAGHEIFFVTKPSIDRKTGLHSVREIVRIIEQSPKAALIKSKMAVFITITTDKNDLIGEYEPFASTYETRVEELGFLIAHGFNTNVMMEPYLSDPLPIINQLMPLIESQGANGIFGVGRMNYTNNMPFVRDHPERKEYLEKLYSKANTARIWEQIRHMPRVLPKKRTLIDILKMYM